MGVGSPRRPKSKQYEDFVAACLGALGYFTESRIILTAGSSEVFELDVIATPCGGSFADRVLFEAKSGAWGFSEIFKLYGLRKYLGIASACIVHLNEASRDRVEALGRISKELDVRCCPLPTSTDHPAKLAEPRNNVPEGLLRTLVLNAWWQQISHRLAYGAFVGYRKSRPDDELCQSARRYELATQQAFFGKTPLDRVNYLYRAYQESPNLAGQFVARMASCTRKAETDIWNEVRDSHKHPWLQFIMALEHRARIAIIKNALEHSLTQHPSPVPGRRDRRIGDATEDSMPAAFREGLSVLRAHPSASRVPYFLQVFIEMFGGFYLTDTYDDLILLSAISGVPEPYVEDCLKLVDVFFPFTKGWFFDREPNLVCMKMVSGFVHGAGCLLRESVYEVSPYSEERPSTVSEILRTWRNALCRVLDRELGA